MYINKVAITCNAENPPCTVYDFRDSTDDVSGAQGGSIKAKSRCHRFGKTGRFDSNGNASGNRE